MKYKARFEELLFNTPECNDFRQLGDGTWMAYAKALDADGVAIREGGANIRDALENLHTRLIKSK